MGFFGDVTDILGFGAPEVPELDPQSQAIQDNLVAQLEAGTKLMEDLQPFELELLGFTRDEAGELRQLTEEERLAGMTPEERLVEQNRLAAEQRFATALAGEGADPLTERELARQRRLIEEQNAILGIKAGGTAFAQSQAALAEAETIARSQANIADINTFGTLGQNLRAGSQNLLASRLSMLRGQPQGVLPFISAGQEALRPGLQTQELGFRGNVAQQQANLAFVPEVSLGF